MSFFQYLVLFEYLLVLFIGFSLCILKLVINRLEKKQKSYLLRIKEVIKEYVVGKKDIETDRWPLTQIAPENLLVVLETFELLIQDEKWQKTKAVLVEKELLPWARAHAKSWRWYKRNLAARIFLLLPLNQDLPYLVDLLEDKSFYIRMLSVAAMSKIPSQEIIAILLQKMADETPPARFPYRQALLKMPLEYLKHVVEIYQNSSDVGIRLVCLDVMSRRFITNLLPLMKKDYQASNSQIRSYIVQILGNLASDESTSELLLFLHDPDPEVRAKAVRSLGKIRSAKTFEKIVEMLQDHHYEVRLEAALALMNFGKEGIRVLELQDWDLNPQSYEVARFVLTLP